MQLLPFGKKKKNSSIDGVNTFENLLKECKQGNQEVVLKILQGAHYLINATDDFGKTPLHVSAMHGHIKTVELLLKNGADCNQRDGSGKDIGYES